MAIWYNNYKIYNTQKDNIIALINHKYSPITKINYQSRLMSLSSSSVRKAVDFWC